jgi:hypothetical protein
MYICLFLYSVFADYVLKLDKDALIFSTFRIVPRRAE